MDTKPSFKICKHYIQGGLTMKKKILSIITTAVMGTAFIGQAALSVPFNADAIAVLVQNEIAESIATADYDQVDDYGLFNNYIPREHITYMRNDGKKFRVFFEENENIYYREIDTVPAFSFKGSAKEFAEKYLEENKIGHMMTDIDMTGVDSIYQTAYADGFTVVFYESVPINTRIKAAAEIAASVKDNTGLPVFMSISPADAVKLSDVNTDAVKVYADVNEFITAEYSGAVVINTTFAGSGQNVTHFITPDGVFHAVKSSSSHYEVITEEGKELPVDEINEKLGESGSLESRGDTYLLINKTGSDDVFLELASYDEVCAIQNVFDFRLYTSDMGYTYADQLFVGGDIDDEAFIAEFPELNLTVSEYPETFGDMTHCFTLRPALSSMTKSETAYNGVKKLAESGYEYAFSAKLTTCKAAWTYAGKGVSTVFSRADENDDNIVKNYSYFKSLNNTQLYEEYKQYREKTERPLETYVTDEGIIKNDYVKVNAKYIKKGIFGVNGFNIEPLESVMIEKNITAQPDYITNEEYPAKHEYLGFDSGYQGEFDIDLSDMGETVSIKPIEALAADTNGTEDTKQAEEVIYECMRCELTIYNSPFFDKYRSECGLVMAGGVLPGKAKEYEEKIGDANVDGEVGLADALTILQYIANSQKYPMYEEGFEVADIVGDGDGVTPLDALEIQKWDAKIV